MRGFGVRLGAMLLLLVGGGLQVRLSATIIEYEVSNLLDNIPGQDRWEYRYFVSGITFNANQGFTVGFDGSHFARLETPSPPTPQWDVLVLQPDLALPAPGAFDAVALTNGAALGQPFVIDFVSLSGTPGSQPFDVNQFDSAGNLVRVLESGVTIPRQAPSPIPEPGSVWLVMAAGAGLAVFRRVISRG